MRAASAALEKAACAALFLALLAVARCGFSPAFTGSFGPQEAWEKAQEVAGVRSSERMQPPRVILRDETRYVSYIDGEARLCGETLVYYVPDGGGELRVVYEVNVYIPDEDIGGVYLTLLHEMLHVVHYQLRIHRGPQWPDYWTPTERYVRRLMPMNCPAERRL